MDDVSRCPELSRLIERLKKGLLSSNSSKYISKIKNPELLIQSLNELNDTIGNVELKSQITKQVEHLIADEIRMKNSQNFNKNSSYINVVLYGPPGTGKTMISLCISKIFFSLGLLRDQNEPVSHPPTSTSTETERMKTYGMMNFLADNIVVILIILSFAWTLSLMIPPEWKVSGMVILGILVLMALMFLFVLNSKYRTGGMAGFMKMKPKSKIDTSTSFMTKATRNSFVGEYLGQTAQKTRDFLEDNIGKVVFIDEAYGLIEGPTDMYGMEATNELVQFMSERPRDIIWILAGYKEQLDGSLFRYQPGFIRRFVYRWHCPGYTPDELFKIFKYQATKNGWSISNDAEVRKVIVDDAHEFKAFAGDMEKLLSFAQMEHSQSLIHNEVEGVTVLSTKHVEDAIKSFKMNKFSDDESSCGRRDLRNELQKFLS